MSGVLGLVGDIGGTHARFALAPGEGGAIGEPRKLDNADYPSMEAAIEAYLQGCHGARPQAAVLAVAGPVTHGAAQLTNLDWDVSEQGLIKAGFKAARLVNDFAAQALGAPRVTGEGLLRIGPDVPGEAGEPRAVMGPGTGFGLAGLAGGVVLDTEGGHAGFAPCDETELEVWRWLARRHGRVSIERILSGQGLYELYLALCEINDSPVTQPDQMAVQAAAEQGDQYSDWAIQRFCGILGSTAGDIALTLGARGGVYVTGGVAQGLAAQLASGPFRERFEDKGRFQGYMRAIPTWLLREPYTALIGAATVLKELTRP